MSHRYRNAADVLLPELLAEVQKYHVGLMWVPKRDSYHKDRIRLIKALLRNKVSVAEIANLANLSRRRVRQIRQEMRASEWKQD